VVTPPLSQVSISRSTLYKGVASHQAYCEKLVDDNDMFLSQDSFTPIKVNLMKLPSVNINRTFREWVRPQLTCLTGQGGKNCCGPYKGNQAGNSPLDEGFFHGLVNHN
jgi:hypothetical protein